MSAVVKFFFRYPSSAESTWAIVRWWEKRRLIYNAAVGAAGVLSLATVAAGTALAPHQDVFRLPLTGILVYGVLANLFYCAGPVLDAAIVRTWGSRYSAVGPALFRYGFAFAVGLSLLPIPVALISLALRLLGVVD